MQISHNYFLVLTIFFFSQFVSTQDLSFSDYARSPIYSLDNSIGHYRTLLAENIGCSEYEADYLLKNSLSFLAALKHTTTVTGPWRVRFNFLLGLYNAYFIALDQVYRLWRVHIAQLSSHNLEELRSIIKKQTEKIDDFAYKAEKMLRNSDEQDDSWIVYEDFAQQKQPLTNNTFPFSPWNQTQMQACVNYTSFRFLYNPETVSIIFKGMFYRLMNLSKPFSQFQSYYLGIQNPISLGYVYALAVKKVYNGYLSFFNDMPEFKVLTSNLYPYWLAEIIIGINCYRFSIDFFTTVYSFASGFKYTYSYEEYLEQIEEASKELKWAKEEYAKIAPQDNHDDDEY